MFVTNGLFIRLRLNSTATKICILHLFPIFIFLQSQAGISNSANKQNSVKPIDAFGVTLTPSNYNGFNISCKGAADGTITTSITSGVSPFTFLWSNSATSQNLSNLSSGTYTVTVTDNLGDQETSTITLIEPAPININVIGTDITCFGGTNGIGDITVNGGAAPYSYLWSTAAITEDITGVPAGNYVITVTDLNNCQASTGFDLIEPDSITITETISNIDCNGAAIGSINIAVIGGTGSFTYLWSNGSTLSNQTNLIANTYTLTVTDAASCTKQRAFVITENPAISVNATIVNIDCFGNNNGSISILASGGLGTLNYLWSNGSTNSNLTNLIAGNYTLTVTDSLNCSVQQIFTITQPATIAIIGQLTNVSCFASNDGSVDISVTGGTGAYSYLWSNGFTTEDIANLIAGSYTITVTDSLNCSNQETFVVNEPTILTVSGIVTDINCFAGSDGSIDITATGGAGNNSYLWSNASTIEDQINLSANNYTVTVTDDNGCTAQQSFVVNEPPGISLSVITDSVICYGESDGAINITASGGAGVLTYLWSNNSNSEDQLNLTADIYSVTVTDLNGCSVQQSFNVLQPDSISIAETITNVLCNSQSSGSINISATGGTFPYNYLWNDGSIIEDRISILANTYTVTISDFHNCTSQKSFVVTEPDSITLTSVITNLLCNGGTNGSIDISATGGTGTLSFLWSNGNITEDISNLIANPYTVTITDSNSCSLQRTFIVNEPPAIIISGIITGINCNNGNTGAIDITVAGGSGSKTYQWSNGSTNEDQANLTANTYTVTVTDSNNCNAQKSFVVSQAASLLITGVVDSVSCNGLTDGSINITASGGTGPLTFLWSNSSINEDLTNLSANTYTVTVTDSLLCTIQQTYVVSEPAIISISGSKTDVSCNGLTDGSINITASGGTGTISYLWSNLSVIEDQINLTANTYTVTVTDANNCSAQQTFVVSEPTLISVSGIITNVPCNGGSNGAINITAIGGTGTLYYLWSNSSTNEDQINLIAGTYIVTVTDSNNCSSQKTFNVLQTSAITISANITNVNCNGGSTGSINITVTGGLAPYTFLWSSSSTLEDQSNLTANSYTVTVTDSLGCIAQQTFVVLQSFPISITGIVVNDSCFGSSNGAIDISVSGGLGTFTYLWSNGSLVADQTNLTQNTYTVTATDSVGCTSQQSFNVTQPTQIVISGVKVNVSCNAGSNGSIDISVTGGTGTFAYLWSNFSSIEDQANLTFGNYTVTVTDFNFCTAQQTYSISQPTPLSASFNNSSSTCNLNNGSSTVIPTGSNGGYTYLWSTSAITQTVTNLAPATYTVTITDSLLCNKSFTTVISAISGLTVSLNNITNVSCNGGNNGAININVSGGTQPFQYLWSNTQTTQDITGLVATNYIVTITDSTSCIEIDTFTVSEPTQLAASFGVINAACGQANGLAVVNASGGTPTYTYLWSNGSSNDSIINVLSGNYTVTVTDTKSCTSVFNTNIGNDAGPSILVDSIINVSCFGFSNGAIYTTGSGGTFPLSYLWSNGFLTDDITALAVNNYTVTVTDIRGCTASVSANVGSPSALTLGFNTTAANCNLSNGVAQANVGGGTGPYHYLWSNNDTTAQTQNLAAGIYTVTITDNHGCIKSDTVGITVSGVPQITLFSQIDVSCNGGNNGSATVFANNGVAPYTYIWSNGDTSNSADSLLAIVYTVTVTDQTGCTKVASYTISQPTLITLQFSNTPEPCNNGNGGASVIANGGTPGYTYLWSTNDTTSSINQLTAGSYTVTITDQNSCTMSAATSVTSTAAPQINLIAVTNLACNGIPTGAVNITVSGGVQSYSYLWSNADTTEDINNLLAGIYSLTVTDANNCQDTISVVVTEPDSIVIGYIVMRSTCNNSNGLIITNTIGGTGLYNYLWSNNATTSSLTNIPAATYTLTVTDANNCTKMETITVSDINEPTIATQNIQAVTCNGGGDGGININVTQGTAPFTFLWSNNDTTQNLVGVAAGIYSVIVTDSNGCVVQYRDTVTEPPAIVVSAAITNATCNLNNGFITVTPIGGTANFSYSWSTGAQSSTISGLTANVIYSITIVDANNCIGDSSFALLNTGSPAIAIVSTTNVTCFNGNNGAIDITVNDGVPPYQYFWSNNTQTEDLQNLFAGNYTLSVTDSMGCTSTQLFTIIEPQEIVISFPFIQNANCNQSNGLVVSNVTGGVPVYNLLWSNNSTNDTISNLNAGNYVITVTDNVGCTQVSNANVSNLNGPLISNIDSVNISCPGGSDGSIAITASGGSGSLTYTWTNNPSTLPNISNLNANTYTVTVRDSANCLTVRSIILNEPSPFILISDVPLLNPPFNLTCFQTGDGMINLSLNGGTPPYNYLWSNGAINDSIKNLSANSYTVVITDANQCTFTDTFNLIEPPKLVAFAGTNFTICGEDQTIITATPISSGLGYWQVINGDFSIVFDDSTAATTGVSNLPIGNNIFQWTVVDGICSDSSTIIVTAASSITSIPGTNRTICGSTTVLDATRPQFGFGYWIQTNGTAIILDSTNALTGVQNLNIGSNNFSWIVSNGSCRDTGSITIRRRDSLDCLTPIEFFTGFTPNNDGVNDGYYIKGIDEYPNNELIIYNRWGQIVYQVTGYNNEEWKGEDKSGNKLPDGTYFVILSIQGIPDVFKNYVDLRR